MATQVVFTCCKTVWIPPNGPQPGKMSLTSGISLPRKISASAKFNTTVSEMALAISMEKSIKVLLPNRARALGLPKRRLFPPAIMAAVNLEDIVPAIEFSGTKLLLKKHDYATYSEIKAEADYFLERLYPSGKKGLEPYKLVAEAKANKNGEIKKLIGVKVIGMTTCPCAKEVIRKIGKYDNNVVPPTHNQRNITTLMIEVPFEDKTVDANDLIDITERSFSAPTYGILKRNEEGEIVYNAHKNPKFVEDVVRDILGLVLKKYSNLPDEVLVIVKSESEESIHKHNAFAERVTTLGELRK